MLDDLSPQEWEAVYLSLKVSLWATACSLPLGILVGLALARGRFWGLSLLNGIVHLPLILPPVVTGYILLLLFGRKGPIGAFLDQSFGIVFAFRWTGAALACGVMGFPCWCAPSACRSKRSTGGWRMPPARWGHRRPGCS